MKKTKIILILITILIGVICIIFYKNSVKDLKIGHNKSSQEIIDYILNINSYEVQVTVDITSNKNKNKYILKQTYQSPNISTQEVIEPNNISGIKIENDGTNLKIENSNLDLKTIFENYNYLGDNSLDLYSFIEDYKQDTTANYEENDDEIIMMANSNIENIYMQTKKLYINKETCNPTKMEIKSHQQNTTIYILYNEVKVNSSK